MAAAATATATTAESETTLPLHRLDVDTYNAIVASGALEGQRVELLDGVLVQMSPQSPAHATVVRLLARHFAASPRWWVDVQSPLEVRPDCEPEPDLAIHAEQPPPDRHPHTALLAIEVAVSSQLIDRDVKGAKYAGAAIPVYWLVDVPARTVEVYTEPGEHGYGRCERYGAGAKLPCRLEGVAEIDLAALFAGVEG
ncbi:MAG: Uma2 family endonuclease [Solirubrobacteraceae bacterium]